MECEKLTEERFIRMIEELFETSKNDALIRAKSFWKSGAIDKEKYSDNYVLPKLFMVAYSSRMKSDWTPLTNEYRKEIKNIEHYV